MVFDPSITVGNILTILALATSAFIFMYRLEGKLLLVATKQSDFNARLEKIDNELEKLTQVAIEMARQDERISAQDMRLNMMAARIDAYAHNNGTNKLRRSNKSSPGSI